ncbi:MAG: peroxiredoxin family protein [Planctomycetota bacterium]|jgi:hypothetical protein
MKDEGTEKIADDRLDEVLKEAFSEEPSPTFARRARRRFDDLRLAMKTHETPGRSIGALGRLFSTRRGGLRTGLGFVAGTACAGIVVALLLLANTTPTWAEVVDRFRSVTFFSATVYRKEDAAAEPEQYELWVGRGARVRLRAGKQVAFGAKGALTRAFDVEARAEASVDRRAQGLVELLGQSGQFSFETLVGTLSGELTDVTPQANSDAVISQDMVVFDLVSDRTAEWMRIWALRESRLPIHVRVWDPRDGESTDVFFSYGKDQPDEFFDADVFASALKDRSRKKSELAYLFLRDPGGRNVTPPRRDEAEAFKVVTTTLDGTPWSLADHKGKAVFLYFWVVDYPSPPHEWVYDVYEKFGDRDDFVMAGVAFGGDAEAVRTRADQWDMKWPQLYEPGKGVSQNTLAEALGVIRTERGVVIWKDGYIDEVYDASLQGKVDGAVLRMTFESARWIKHRLRDLMKDKERFDKDYLEALCGPPDSVEAVEEGAIREKWHYRRRNEGDTKAESLDIGFDGEGHYTGFSAGSGLIDPATLEVYIGPEFWKREIEDKLKPRLLAGLGEKYEFCVQARADLVAYPANPGQLAKARAGHTWSRRLPFGTYNLNFIVRNREKGGIEWSLTLAENVEFARNEKKTFRFE